MSRDSLRIIGIPKVERESPKARKGPPALKREGVCPNGETTILYCRNGTGVLKSEICAGSARVLFKEPHRLLQQRTLFYCIATVLAVAMKAALTGISGMLFAYCLLSVFWLSSLRGVRICGLRRGLASRLGCTFLLLFF